MVKAKELLKKLSPNKKSLVLAIVAVLAIVFLIFSEFATETAEEAEEEILKTGVASTEYIKTQEEKLALLLEKIDGAGEVEVMITLESCYENVYLKDSTLKTESTKGIFKEEQEESFIMAKTGSDTQNGIIIKVYEPVVKGVAVVASGGDNETVKMAIIETVSAVFNINSTNISVEKMVSEGME